MATIRVRDWTKERIEEIREAESHSSHDSVIKALLKDRELAQFATPAPEPTDEPAAEESAPAEKAFDDLTVLDELHTADNGLLFLWCPNCGNEMVHLEVENPVTISVFEAECQRCLTRLDQHAVVAIEIGYPIEQRLVDETLLDDLRECVVDYWNRVLRDVANGNREVDVDDEQFVWTLGEYYREFGWGWPSDVPIVAFDVGATYRDDATDERFEVLAVDAENRNAPDDYRIGWLDGGETREDVLDANDVLTRVLGRTVYVES